MAQWLYLQFIMEKGNLDEIPNQFNELGKRGWEYTGDNYQYDDNKWAYLFKQPVDVVHYLHNQPSDAILSDAVIQNAAHGEPRPSAFSEEEWISGKYDLKLVTQEERFEYGKAAGRFPSSQYVYSLNSVNKIVMNRLREHGIVGDSE